MGYFAWLVLSLVTDAPRLSIEAGTALASITLGFGALWSVVATARDRRVPVPTRTGWALLSLGVAANWLGDVAWSLAAVVGGGVASPSIAEVAYLAAYPLLFAGLVAVSYVWLRPIERARLDVDALIVLVVALIALVVGLVGPGLRLPDGPNLTVRLLEVVYPAGSAMLLVGVALAWLRRGALADGAWLTLLVGAFGSFFVADILWAWLEHNESYDLGGMPDVLYFPSIALTTAAVEGVPRHTDAASPARARAIGISLLP